MLHVLVVPKIHEKAMCKDMLHTFPLRYLFSVLKEIITSKKTTMVAVDGEKNSENNDAFCFGHSCHDPFPFRRWKLVSLFQANYIGCI